MELTVIISPEDSSWETADEIVKKICEEYDTEYRTVHIVVKDVKTK